MTLNCNESWKTCTTIDILRQYVPGFYGDWVNSAFI